MSGARVLILGATGSIGEATAEHLVRRGEHVSVSSRSMERASILKESVGAAHAVAIDVGDPDWVMPDDVEVVLDCTGRDRIDTALRVTGSGCTHIDISASIPHVRRALDLDEKIAATGHTAILGAGLAPGISTSMAHRLVADDLHDRSDVIRIDLILDLFDRFGGQASTFTTSLIGDPFWDPATGRRIANFSDPSVRQFPAGFGDVTTARVGFSDVTILDQRLGRSLRMHLGFRQRGIVKLLDHLGRRHIGIARRVIDVGGRLSPPRPRAWVCVASNGDDRIWATGIGQASATAAHVGLLVRRLRTGTPRPGVVAAHEVAPLDDSSCVALAESGIALAFD